MLIEFDEGKNSPSNIYKKYVDENVKQLNSIAPNIETKKIKLLRGSGRKTRRVGDREAANIILIVTLIYQIILILLLILVPYQGVYFFLLLGKFYLYSTTTIGRIKSSHIIYIY